MGNGRSSCLKFEKETLEIKNEKKKNDKVNIIKPKENTSSIVPSDIIGVIRQIESMTNFKTYLPYKVNINHKKNPINGMYFQFDRGCILYTLINEGWIDEKDIPDSMKYYKNHNYSQDETSDKTTLIKLISVLDLAQLWTNLGGESPYIEISVEEAKRRIFLVLKNYFEKNEKEELKKAFKMSRQFYNYFDLLGTIKVSLVLLRDIIKDEPNIKTAADNQLIQKGDILLTDQHFIIFDGIKVEDNLLKYCFKDSITNFYAKKDDKYHKEDCKIYENEGIVEAYDNCLLIRAFDTDDYRIGILKILN